MKEGFSRSEWSEYTRDDNQQYCDKGGHKERSLYHSPQHANHWKKEEKKRHHESDDTLDKYLE